jgi:hypothetical protein
MTTSNYSTINMNTFPGEMKLPGKTLLQQAINANYQDIPRDIQLQRQAAFRHEVADGQFSPQFGQVNASDPATDLLNFLNASWLNKIMLAVMLYGYYEMGRYSFKHHWPGLINRK